MMRLGEMILTPTAHPIGWVVKSNTYSGAIMKNFKLFGLALCFITLLSCGGSNQSNSNSGTDDVTSSGYLIGYWHAWGPILDINSIPSEYKVVNIAFPDVDTSGTISISNPTAQQIADLKAQGQKVILSIGGANDIIPLESTETVTNFVNSIIQIIERDGYDGIDIDFEGATLSSTGNNTLDHMLEAMKQILEHPTFQGKLFTMAPETYYVYTSTLSGPPNFYRAMLLNEWNGYDFQSQIDWVQVQFYNSGSVYADSTETTIVEQGTKDFIIELNQRLINEFGLDESQVAVGVLADTGAGYIDASTLKLYIEELKVEFPDLRGLMTWSINLDMENSYAMATEIGPVVNSD